MIYNNGTISVHKNHIGNLLFAVVRSGLVEDGLEARKMIRVFKNEALLELEDYYNVGVDGCIEEQLKRSIDILDNLKIRAKVQIDFYGDGGDTGIEGRYTLEKDSSKLRILSTDEIAIMDASDRSLIEELIGRGYSVTKGEAEPAVYEGDDDADYIKCPHCDEVLAANDDYHEIRPAYCPKCGCKIKY